MYTFRCLNNISGVGLKHFTGDYKQVGESDKSDAILVRSAKLNDMEFDSDLKCIARAGAGVNNIPLDRCAEQGIVVFNTPGANANGVKELVIAGMLLASRDIIGGIEWLEQQENTDDLAKRVEKQKKQYAGCEIAGKKLGIIGLGAIGVMVANAAVSLGMEVYGYDPYVSLHAAWNLSSQIKYVKDLDEIYSTCDFITIHVPLNDGTRGMISADGFTKMKDGVVLLNFARNGLVDEDALVEALKSGKVKKYVTDFVTPKIEGIPNTIITPHLGASTKESEDNCAVMAAHELMDYIENGNIKNSVNFPDASLPQSGDYRLCVLHKNEPGIVAKLATVVADEKLNIANMINKSKGEYAYTIIEINGSLPKTSVEKVASLDNIIRTRVIEKA